MFDWVWNLFLVSIKLLFFTLLFYLCSFWFLTWGVPDQDILNFHFSWRWVLQSSMDSRESFATCYNLSCAQHLLQGDEKRHFIAPKRRAASLINTSFLQEERILYMYGKCKSNFFKKGIADVSDSDHFHAKSISLEFCWKKIYLEI